MKAPVEWLPGMRVRCIDSAGTDKLRQEWVYLVTRVHNSPAMTYLTLAPDQSIALGWCADRFVPVIPACDRLAREQTGLYPDSKFWDRDEPNPPPETY